MNYYQPNGYINPYFNQQMQQPLQQSVQQNFNQQQMQQPVQQTPLYKPQTSILQGKSVDSVEVVKATDIPLDGSVSYFPLADGTAIVTKQLQQDGTSRIIVYRPVDEKEEIKKVDYLTRDDLNKALNNLDNKDILKDIKELKRQFKDLSEDFEEFKDRKD